MKFCTKSELTALLLLLVVFQGLDLHAQNQKTIPIKFQEAQKYWQQNHGDTFLVVNFWATWCKPCVAELPCFEQIQEKYKNKPLKVILVSQDYRDVMESRVNPFIRKRNIRSDVWLMDESNPNIWIDQVDSGWSGAIPATLFVKPSGAYAGFYQKEFHCSELDSLIQTLNP